MRIINSVLLLSLFSAASACGGGGSSSSVPSVSTSSAAISSSSASSSSLSSVAISSSSASSSSAASVVAYPSYNTTPLAADMTGVASTATQIASKIKLGLNVGNTLEAVGCAPAAETCWGNPKITKAFITFVKQTGFTAVRLPASWDQYSNKTTAQIDINWLNRVKEVVQYCVDNDLYVIVNIHYDGGWLEKNVTPEMQAAVNAKQKAFWEQIATQLRDFDEHVMFASANEPSVTYSSQATTQQLADAAVQMSVLLSYHQTFIDAVRATGGKNSYRTLIVQGPSTDVEATNKLMTTMPIDTVANRLIAEVHYYTPWNFTGMTKDETWGNQFFYWGKDFHSMTDTAHNPTWGEEDTVNNFLGLMKTQFVDKGIPVIIGEFGTMHRTNLTGDALTLHLNSVAHYLNYVSKQSIADGLVPFYWDTGSLLDRTNNTVLNQKDLDALLQSITP